MVSLHVSGSPHVPQKKKSILKIGIVAFAVSVFFFTILAYLNLSNDLVGADFRLRYNEVQCVRSGIDPYLVWSGAIQSDAFYSYNHPEWKTAASAKPVNAYPPWEYTFLLPLTFLPYPVAWHVYRIGEIAILVLFAIWNYHRGLKVNHDALDGLFLSASALFVGMPTWTMVKMDNYGIFFIPVAILLARSLASKREIVSGLCLAVLMIKPQIGVLFAITALFQGRWRSCVAGAVVCMLASLYPAVLLHLSPLDLVLQIPQYGSDVAHSSLLVPNRVFVFLAKSFGHLTVAAANGVAGLLLFSIAAWRLRRSEEPIERILPAILFIGVWTYCSWSDRWLWCIPQTVLALAIIKCSSRKDRVFLASCMLCLASSSWMIFHSGCIETWASMMDWNVISGTTAKILYFGTTLAMLFGVLGTCWGTIRKSSANANGVPR